MGVLRALWSSFRYCRVEEDVRSLPRPARFLAASRLCVLPMTIYSVLIGGVAAYIRYGQVDWAVLLSVLLGFALTHMSDNLVNDLTDYLRGIDEPGYFRVAYGPHPIVDGILSPRDIKVFVGAVLLYDAALALTLSLLRSPVVGMLAVVGAVIMGMYAGYPVDAKRMGMGEVLVAIVWGPVIMGGTYVALTGRADAAVFLLSVPHALSVMGVLVGKHLDKYGQDIEKGVKTLPVRLGVRRARMLAASILIASPIIASALIMLVFSDPVAAVVPLAALPASVFASRKITSSRPQKPPKWWRLWPLWYVAWSYMAMDGVGKYMLLAMLSTALKPWPSYVVYALTALSLALDINVIRSLGKDG